MTHLKQNCEEQRENLWYVYYKPQTRSNWLLGSFKVMILSYRTLNRACIINTKLYSLNVSEVIFVLVYQYFDCRALIKKDIVRERQNERKICVRKQTRLFLFLVRNMASASATVTTQSYTN
jgi:hypothetical protein